jgi:malonyl-CoA/methylmalonyl-CoA synthetase
MEYRNLNQWFEAACFSRPHRIALRFYRDGGVETELSYQELDRATGQMANLLAAYGVGVGDRVGLLMPKSLIFVVAYIAVQRMGAMAVPWNDGFKAAELKYLIEDAVPRLVIAGVRGATLLRELVGGLAILEVNTGRPFQDWDGLTGLPVHPPPVRIGTHDPAMILYTSGTTGDPKGALLTHGNLMHNLRSIIQIWEINPEDVLCHALPIFHIHGLVFALHSCLLANARIHLVDRFSPERVIDMLSDRREGERCSVFMAVPTMYTQMLRSLGQSRRDFGHMRLWTSGSAPLRPEDFQRIQAAFGSEPVEREGMSETGMNFSNPIHGRRVPGSVGLPLPDLQVRIVDPEGGEDLPVGQIGEIWLRGPAITPGYWRKPAQTKEAFVGGWFRSGDLGRQDENGYFYLTDRLKHIIISGGENISPKQVERVINRLEGVAECSVVGVPDPLWGELVVAALVLEPGVEMDVERVVAHCREKLHDWKCPKMVQFMDRLPRNSMGKVMKEEVARSFQ